MVSVSQIYTKQSITEENSSLLINSILQKDKNQGRNLNSSNSQDYAQEHQESVLSNSISGETDIFFFEYSNQVPLSLLYEQCPDVTKVKIKLSLPPPHPSIRYMCMGNTMALRYYGNKSQPGWSTIGYNDFNNLVVLTR